MYMHGGLHTSVGRRRGGMGRESDFSQRKPPTLLPGYGNWIGSIRTKGITGLQKKQAASAKEKADVIT